MNVKPGMIVKSAAGRDRDKFMVITAAEGDFAYIADGKERKLSTPKKKRLKHLRLTNTVMDMNNLTDKGLRRLIAEFSRNSSAAPTQDDNLP